MWVEIWLVCQARLSQFRRKSEEMRISADRLDRLRYLSKGDRHDCLDRQIAIIILVISSNSPAKNSPRAISDSDLKNHHQSSTPKFIS